MGDPVAEKSAFLRMYMSNHPDTLVAYAKWFGKVEEALRSAEMSSIDCKSMTLTCTLQNGSKKTVIVSINPPLKGYEDVKPRLLEMKALAQEGLGMIKSPKITFLSLPKNAIVFFLGSLCAIYLHLVPHPDPSSLINALQSFLGPFILSFIFWSIIILHCSESVYTLYLCRIYSAGFVRTAVYVIATVLCGFPIWVHIRKKIQQLRIDSVMKIQ